MIEPFEEGAEFKMVWNGGEWQISLKGFLLKDIMNNEQLGTECSELVLEAFMDNIEKMKGGWHAVFNRGPAAAKFKGNK